MIRLYVAALSLLGLQFAQAQNNLGGWLMYFGDASLPKTALKLNYEIQHRNHEIYNDLNQLLVRGSVQYNGIENLGIAAGYAYVITEKENKPDAPFYENRIFQELSTQQNFSKVKVKHRLRFEQRFFDNQDFRSRVRYNFLVEIPWTKKENGSSFYTTMYNEIFINTNKTPTAQSVFDRNRFSFGKGYRFNKNFAVQASWMTQILEKGNDPQITLSLHHSI